MCGTVGGDDGDDERTGIAEGGWRKEQAEAKTQLNKDMEKENGEGGRGHMSVVHQPVARLANGYYLFHLGYRSQCS